MASAKLAKKLEENGSAVEAARKEAQKKGHSLDSVTTVIPPWVYKAAAKGDRDAIATIERWERNHPESLRDDERPTELPPWVRENAAKGDPIAIETVKRWEKNHPELLSPDERPTEMPPHVRENAAKGDPIAIATLKRWEKTHPEEAAKHAAKSASSARKDLAKIQEGALTGSAVKKKLQHGG